MPSLQYLLLSTLLITLFLSNGLASGSGGIETTGFTSEQIYLTARGGPYGRRPHRGIGRRERLAAPTPTMLTRPTRTASIAPTQTEHLYSTLLDQG